MIAHISERLQVLAEHCKVEEREAAEGWSIDCWELSSDALAALAQLYEALLVPETASDVLASLVSDGIRIGELFHEVGDGDSKHLANLTRADILELAGAASMIAQEGIPIDTLFMANVPKASRRQSTSGIDILAGLFDSNGPPDGLGEQERLYIGSVKHTIADVGDMRRKLVASVSAEELSLPYLVGQLRVFHGRLAERGIMADRVFHILRMEPLLNPDHVRIVAIGALDRDHKDQLDKQGPQLRQSEPRLRHLRWLLVDNIENLTSLEVR